MRYCSNDKCEIRKTCLRWQLGRRFIAGEDYGSGYWRTRRPGNWVKYGGCEDCRQYIHNNQNQLKN